MFDPPAGSKPNKEEKAKKGKKPPKIRHDVAIQKLFAEHIDPAEFEVVDTNEFRENFLYTFKVNQFFERNMPVLERLRDQYNHAGMKVLNPHEALNLVQVVAGLNYLPDRQI